MPWAKEKEKTEAIKRGHGIYFNEANIMQNDTQCRDILERLERSDSPTENHVCMFEVINLQRRSHIAWMENQAMLMKVFLSPQYSTPPARINIYECTASFDSQESICTRLTGKSPASPWKVMEIYGVILSEGTGERPQTSKSRDVLLDPQFSYNKSKPMQLHGRNICSASKTIY